MYIELKKFGKTYYNVVGEGNPLVIIHGGLGLDHGYLQHWLLPLSEHCKVYFVDLPGNGRSTEIDEIEEYTLEYLTDFIEAFRQNVIKGSVNILGHSYGALLSAIYSIRYQGNVKKMVLVDSLLNNVPRDEDTYKEKIQKLPEENQKIVSRYDEIDKSFSWKEYLKNLIPIYFHNKQMVEHFHEKNESLYKYKASLRSVEEIPKIANYMEQYDKIDHPVLLVQGKFDCIVDIESQRLFINKVKNCQVEIFEKSGHFPFIEEQELFLAKVENFLRG